MNKTENTQPFGQHFGRVPSDRLLLAERHRAHDQGFNTMLMSDYEELAKVGLGPDQMGTVLAAVSRFRFGLATFDSPV